MGRGISDAHCESSEQWMSLCFGGGREHHCPAAVIAAVYRALMMVHAWLLIEPLSQRMDGYFVR